MSETASYNAFRNGIIMPGDRIDRVENLRLEGMFDVNCCIDGLEFWIELKYAAEPVREKTRLLGKKGLSQEQKNWAKAQLRAGGAAFILITTDRRRILMDAGAADVVNEMSVSELRHNAIQCLNIPTPHGHWAAFRKNLLRAAETVE